MSVSIWPHGWRKKASESTLKKVNICFLPIKKRTSGIQSVHIDNAVKPNFQYRRKMLFKYIITVLLLLLSNVSERKDKKKKFKGPIV